MKSTLAQTELEFSVNYFLLQNNTANPLSIILYMEKNNFCEKTF